MIVKVSKASELFVREVDFVNEGGVTDDNDKSVISFGELHEDGSTTWFEEIHPEDVEHSSVDIFKVIVYQGGEIVQQFQVTEDGASIKPNTSL